MSNRLTELGIESGLLFQRDKLSYEEQKFSELIILECAEINKQELAFNALAKLLERYSEHFGSE